MKRVKRLSEILEECIEAGISGRRSLEASLALYPAQAEELEPLLRTAFSVSDSFQSFTPPAAIEQRVRSRFLADAAARRHLRHLEGSFEERGWLAGLFRKPVFAGFAAAAAVAVAAVAITIGGVNLGGNEDGGNSPVGPTVVFDLGNRLESINERIDSGGQIQQADVAEISALLAQLKAASREELRASADDLAVTLPGTLALLEGGRGIVPDDPSVAEAIAVTRDIAAGLNLDLPGPIEAGDATPVPTDQPVEPTDAPAKPTPTAVSGTATAAPTATPPPPQPTPTATADLRAPPGFLP
jgi:hypothetical protein